MNARWVCRHCQGLGRGRHYQGLGDCRVDHRNAVGIRGRVVVCTGGAGGVHGHERAARNRRERRRNGRVSRTRVARATFQRHLANIMIDVVCAAGAAVACRARPLVAGPRAGR